MESGTTEIKEHLLHANEDFKRLMQKHHHYDEELERLTHKSHLSEEEKVEEVKLKKMKLHVKDQMEIMIQQYRQQAVKSTGPAS